MPDSHAKSHRSLATQSAALEALSARYRAALLGYFRRRVSDAAEAEDLVQEVFLRMLRRGSVSSIEDAL
jgi:RNA polymerase sigma-70 factor (ECF subfamily)